METNNQGLAKEEKIMFIILGIILLVSIGVLIINSFSNKENKLDNNDTPIKETSGQKDNIKDDNNNEPVDILIEEETEEEEIVEEIPVVNIPSSTGNSKDQSNSKPKPKPVVLDWSFKNTMITNAFNGDIITIEKNVLLTNGKEQEASIVVMKNEENSWTTVDITTGTFQVSTGLYKYIYSYGSSTKELLLTVIDKQLTIDTITILQLNELLDETSTITQEEYDKYQTIISNTTLETNVLTINNYVDTNNLLPLVINFSEDMTAKNISTTTLGIAINKEQNDWHEVLTPNSIIMWLDLNDIDITNNIIILEIDGVTHEIELNITINKEETSNPDQGELDNDQDTNLDNNENLDEEENQEENNNDETIDDTNSNEEEQEDNMDPVEPSEDEENDSTNQTENNEEETEPIDPIENEEEEIDTMPPTEEEQVENSSQEMPSSEEQIIEENSLQPETTDISEQKS